MGDPRRRDSAEWRAPAALDIRRGVRSGAQAAHPRSGVVVLFRQSYGLRPDGTRRTHYYSQESCGITAGFFIAAVHMMGLVMLTHTPSPMGFLSELLWRPANEKAMLVMPVGYPAADARVPDLQRKALGEIAVWK